MSTLQEPVISRPGTDESPAYFLYYFGLVPEDDLLEALAASRRLTIELMKTVPPGVENYRYAQDKWTVKQVLQHVTDAERIFAYRALRFARKDATPLPGFSENSFAENDFTRHRALQDLVTEFQLVRDSTIALFRTMNDEMLDFRGMANQTPASARSVGWMIAGHNIHHLDILKARYL